MRPLQAVWFLFYFAIIMTCLIPATSLTLFIVESWKCSDLENVISVEGTVLNYAQSDFCSSGSDYATYISFEVVMGLYGISCLVFTVICFAMYYLTEDHKVEGVTERLKEDNRLLDHQY
ncbi:hypothetical protein QTN25_003624 [Entamoeba marina]